MKFINTNNLISENQIGFKEKARTADHIFSLKSIVDKYKTKKKKIFAAFIDLRKAFDTVWREGLFYILLQNRLPGKLFNVIQSMYNDNKCRIKFQNGISHEFISNCGVKQGDVLSPTLFNIYINGLVNDLDHANTQPIIIGDVKLTSLLYADDIILLSETQEGLQNALNELTKFCSLWKLDVNKQKSKIIIFNSNGKSHCNYFKVEKEHLETVKSICYLGITINCSGSLNHSKKNLMEKGRKAWFKIKKTVSLDNSCSMLEKLFDTLVVPITLYGSEVWGVSQVFKDSDPFEHLHIKFIKEILGVQCKTTNVACLTETNRIPLYFKIQLSAIKFLNHIVNSPNTLVHKIYNNVEKTSKWVNIVKDWLNKLGFGHLTFNTFNLKYHINSIQQRIYDQAYQIMNCSINKCEKLNFFCHTKRIRKRPPYIDICKFKTDRSVFSKFKLSAHSLAIERGRYTNIERSKRICLSCNRQEIEDEYHFFSICPCYKSLRDTYIQNINKNLNFNFIKLQSTITLNHLTVLLNSSLPVIIKITIKYINDCLLLRTSV